MAIRRTREDKLQAKMRREDGGYSWKPESKQLVKKTAATEKIQHSNEDRFFWKDIRRTAFSVAIIAILLALAVIAL